MEYSIDKGPEFAWLRVKVPAHKKLFVEAGSMATMTVNMRLKALFKGGFRRFFTKESLFLTEILADQMDGKVSIAPAVPGDIGHVELKGDRVYLSSASYLAHSEGVEYQTKFQKLSKGLLSGAGWFLIEMSGLGDVWFNGYGALLEVAVEDELLVDNGHLVAFTDGIDYEIIKIGSYKSLFFSGEGFVCRFRGQGRVWIQTKKPQALISWAHYFRPVERRN